MGSVACSPPPLSVAAASPAPASYGCARAGLPAAFASQATCAALLTALQTGRQNRVTAPAPLTAECQDGQVCAVAGAAHCLARSVNYAALTVSSPGVAPGDRGPLRFHGPSPLHPGLPERLRRLPQRIPESRAPAADQAQHSSRYGASETYVRPLRPGDGAAHPPCRGERLWPGRWRSSVGESRSGRSGRSARHRRTFRRSDHVPAARH